MLEESMNDMVAPGAKTGTPLSIFQSELSKFKSGQKRKNLIYVVLPLLAVGILIGGFLLYRHFDIQKDRKILNQNLSDEIRLNEEILISNQKNGISVPQPAVNDALKKMEKTKIENKYTLTPEEIERIKKSNQ